MDMGSFRNYVTQKKHFTDPPSYNITLLSHKPKINPSLPFCDVTHSDKKLFLFSLTLTTLKSPFLRVFRRNEETNLFFELLLSQALIRVVMHSSAKIVLLTPYDTFNTLLIPPCHTMPRKFQTYHPLFWVTYFLNDSTSPRGKFLTVRSGLQLGKSKMLNFRK